MLLPSPANRVSGYRRMESPTPELQFGIVNSIATLDQAREPSGALGDEWPRYSNGVRLQETWRASC